LRAQGYRTGLFTSPHLVTFRERIRVNGEMISEDEVAHGLTSIRQLVADWDPHPTFFEIATALGLQHFKNKHCEIVVLETGMGGRLDATNAVTPVVSVITPIDYDHQKWLGNSLGEIAAEKAGIIKPHVPLVSAVQSAEAENVIRARALACEAPRKFVTENYAGDVALKGAHQKRNAAVAIAGLRAARIEVSEKSIVRGLTNVSWPARFQRWDERTIIDGAHNPGSARMLVKTWREIFDDEKAALVFGVFQDKQIREIFSALNEIMQSVHLPGFHGPRVAAPMEVAAIVHDLAPAKPVSIHETCGQAIEAAQRTGARVLIAGSLHLAGEALAYLQGTPAAFEECDQ
ncbi:MAG: bifunctional folylpolyglutamate synthase/dihydrofolate synthase, partial [Chthoniobacterales bacterium]